MSTAKTPAINEPPYLDLDADLVEAINKKPDPDYEEVRRLLYEAASMAEKNGERLGLHPDAARLLGDIVTPRGRKKKPGPQVDLAQKALRLGRLGHEEIERLTKERRAARLEVKRNEIEMEVASELGTNPSDLKAYVAGYRKFLKEQNS